MKLDTIINGDCIGEMARLDEGCVDLVFADPPFNIGYDYDQYNDKRTYDDYWSWTKEWMTQVRRILKDDGTFWLAIGDEYAAELKVLATRELGLTCRSWVIWYYTFGVYCKQKFTRSHAHLFHFVKDARRFTFNDDAVRVPSARQLVYADKRANPKGRVPDDTWIIPPKITVSAANEDEPAAPAKNGTNGKGTRGRQGRQDEQDQQYRQLDMHGGWVLRPQDATGGFAPDSDTWYYSRVCGTFGERRGFHGCQMPEQVLGRIIKVSSDPGDTVLDPFSGSGTTIAVAKKLDRRYVGIELSADYAKQTEARLQDIKPGDALDGVVDPLRTAPKTADGRDLETVKKKRARAKAKAKTTTATTSSQAFMF